MITKIQRQNLSIVLTDRKHPKHASLEKIIKAYEGGKPAVDLCTDWVGGGTSGKAIQEYLKNNVEQKPKPKRTAKEEAGK